MKLTIYKNICAVYRLTNSFGEFYVGSSINLYQRLRSHKSKNRMKEDFEKIKIDILEIVSDKRLLKSRENHYLQKLWSDKILNIEKKSTGRDLYGKKNPMFKGPSPVMHCLDCKKQITYHTTKQPKRCKSCSAKNRHRDSIKKTFI